MQVLNSLLNFNNEINFLIKDDKMLNKTIKSIFMALILFNSSPEAATKQISITIDDLPFVGSSAVQGDTNHEHDRFAKIIQTLVDEQIPVTGFVIAGSIAKGQWQLLENFRKLGFIIGNHTYTHPNLSQIGAEKYINEIAKADKRLTPLMTDKKYFRYPYLAEGRGQNKQRVRAYLAENQYIISPITIDSKDFRFNEQLLAINWRKREASLEKMKERYLSYIWKETEKAEKRAHGRSSKQILLIHSNLLNSYLLGDVIQLFRDHGYQFISLDEALTTDKHAEHPIEAFKENIKFMVNQFASINSFKDNRVI